MNARFFGILAVLVTVLVGGVSAQAKSNSDTKVFAFEMGTGFNYDVKANVSTPTQTFSAVFGFSDAVQAGFSIIRGDAAVRNFSLVKVAVFPASDVSVNLLFGGDGAATPKIISGFGMGYNVFRNTSGSLTTSLQVSTQYLFNVIAEGNLGIGLNLKVGI